MSSRRPTASSGRRGVVLRQRSGASGTSSPARAYSTCASYGDGRGIGRNTRSLERCTRIDGCDASGNSAHTAPRAHMALRVDGSCHDDNAHLVQAAHPPSAPRRL